MNKWYTQEGLKIRRKDLRDINAEVIALRMEERAKRTPEQQLALLDSRPGKAKKERARLLKQIEERNKPKEKKPTNKGKHKHTTKEKNAKHKRQTPNN